MLPFEPESLESMRARLPQALSVVYNYEIIEAGGQRPGELRQQVFDFEDGVRCILSIDEGHETARHIHMSFSLQDYNFMSVAQFMHRMNTIPAEFWPDTLLVPIARFQTPRAIHFAFEYPHSFEPFLKVCGERRKTVPSAG